MRIAYNIPALLLLTMVMANPASAESTGWRGDGSGLFPKATPPTEWSATKNIVWATAMPKFSNASPVIVGEQLFICAEPYELICLNLKDGKIQWQHGNTIVDTLPEAEQKSAKADADKAATLYAQTKKLAKQLGKKKKLLKKAADKTELTAAIKTLAAELAKANADLSPVKKFLPPSKHNANGTSTATPVTDGKMIFTTFGNGVSVGYDLQGNRKWCTFLELPSHGWGFSASPLLVDGKVIVHIKDMIALDAQTGKEVWRAKIKYHWGSPVTAKIGAETCIATPGGEIIRAKDGKILASKLHNTTYNAPVLIGDTLFYIDQKGGKAVRLPAEAKEAMKPEVLWKNKPKSARYYSSPIVHDGLVYAINQKGFFSVFDAKDGKEVYTQSLKLGKGTVYPSLTLAGSYLYISSDNGTTLVIKTGRTYSEVATNKLEQFRSSPVFIGTRMYLRGYKKMYCIETKG